MVAVCFYFQCHQPLRLRNYSVFDIGKNHNYFDEDKNKEIIERVAKKCYMPTNRLMLELINQHRGSFRISYSITGILVEQLMKFAPKVLEGFKKLADTGCVEFLSETYHHSLAFLYSKKEFDEQIRMHRTLIKRLFRQEPRVFRNTELIYNNELAQHVASLGYEGVLAEGADKVLGWRSPNYVYNPVNANIKLLLKNYKLSDDIAFRFSKHDWPEYPLTAEKFAKWVSAVNGSGTNVNLFMDYETIGEHQWAQTGIFRFFKKLPGEILKHRDNSFVTCSELLSYDAVAELDVPFIVSWADVERDLSAWLGNKMQQSAIGQIYSMGRMIKKNLLDDWRKLQTSDHFYYMCTKWFADGDVHKYFNPYDNPYDGFISYMNVLNDLIIRTRSS